MAPPRFYNRPRGAGMPSPLSGQSLSDAFMRRGQMQAAGIQAQQRPWVQAVQSIGQETAGSLRSAMKERHELPQRQLQEMSDITDMEYRRTQIADAKANRVMNNLKNSLDLYKTYTELEQNSERFEAWQAENKHEVLTRSWERRNQGDLFREKIGQTLYQLPEGQRESVHNAYIAEGIESGLWKEGDPGTEPYFAPLHTDEHYKRLWANGQPLQQAWEFGIDPETEEWTKTNVMLAPGESIREKIDNTIAHVKLIGPDGQPVSGTKVTSPVSGKSDFYIGKEKIENPKLWESTLHGPKTTERKLTLVKGYNNDIKDNDYAFVDQNGNFWDQDKPDQPIEWSFTPELSPAQLQMVAANKSVAASFASLANRILPPERIGELKQMHDIYGKPLLTGSESAIFRHWGPNQLVMNLLRKGASLVGMDTAMKLFEDHRFAMAGELAVASQGSRPSDADIKAVWLPMIPGLMDTRDTALAKMNYLRTWMDARDISLKRGSAEALQSRAEWEAAKKAEDGTFYGEYRNAGRVPVPGETFPDGRPKFEDTWERWAPAEGGGGAWVPDEAFQQQYPESSERGLEDYFPNQQIPMPEPDEESKQLEAEIQRTMIKPFEASGQSLDPDAPTFYDFYPPWDATQ